ncbi:MAG: hypothetical protein VYE15_02155 [Myxococcota bacterium]|nr:hypothetical protein [Myxococcota bacterium]
MDLPVEDVEAPAEDVEPVEPDVMTPEADVQEADVTPDVVEEDVFVLPDQDFVLGVNQVGTSHPSFFSPLLEGDTVRIELGAQGLWMVVLAFKTRGYFGEKVIVRGKLEVEGLNQGELALAKQKLLDGGDGYRYYFNFFLVVLDPGVSGLEGVAILRVTDDENHDIEQIRETRVVLTGGQPSAAPLCAPECDGDALCFNNLGVPTCTCAAGADEVDGICATKCDPPCHIHGVCSDTVDGSVCLCPAGEDPETGECKKP